MLHVDDPDRAAMRATARVSDDVHWSIDPSAALRVHVDGGSAADDGHDPGSEPGLPYDAHHHQPVSLPHHPGLLAVAVRHDDANDDRRPPWSGDGDRCADLLPSYHDLYLWSDIYPNHQRRRYRHPYSAALPDPRARRAVPREDVGAAGFGRVESIHAVPTVSRPC